MLWKKLVFKYFLYLDLRAAFISQGSSTGPVLFVRWSQPSQLGQSFMVPVSVVMKSCVFFSLLGLSLGNFIILGGRPRRTRERTKRRAVFLHLRCDACLGFVGFPRAGVMLSPLCHQRGGQPSCRSPQCLSIANLSTAGRFHGDHSWAGRHGYGGTLAVGWGAAAAGWGYLAIPGQAG